MKIKGNKKDMERTEKPFEHRRALDCEKRPCSPVGTCVGLVCVGGEPGQTSPSRTRPISLWTALPWSGAGDDRGAFPMESDHLRSVLSPSSGATSVLPSRHRMAHVLCGARV